MADTWSPQQAKAINTVGKNILVSASAGAGKTTVLIARLMKRITQDKMPVDSILAMTFTEAAASEMKKRLLDSLNKELEKPNSDKEYLRKQLVALQNAHISTIHSFCLFLIKENYALIALDPARIDHILDEATLSVMQSKALETVLERRFASSFEQMNACARHFSARSEDFEAMKDAIRKIASISKGSGNSEKWLDQAVADYQRVRTFKELPLKLREGIFFKLRLDAKKLESAVQACADYLRENDLLESKQAEETALKQKHLERLFTACDELDYRSYHAALKSFACVKTSVIRKNDEYNELRKRMNDLSKDLVQACFEEEELLRNFFANEPIIRTLAACAKDYLAEYERLKELEQGIDFDDMEQLAYRILTIQNGRIAEKYKRQFNEIMVDEFQDTNTIQDQIIRCIAKDNNVFRVGDIKQSIYKFRGAKPQIMRNLIHAKGENDEVIYLANNYRSKEAIVDFNNALFAKLMNCEGLADEYTEQDYVKTGVPAQKIDNHVVEFIDLCKARINEKDEAKQPRSAKQIKADYIAARILQMKESTEFTKWKDYAILVRSHRDKAEIKEALDKANIPSFIDAKSGFYQSDALQTILPVLRLLVDERDEISLIAVLSSDFFRASDEELARLKIAKGKLDWMSYLRLCKHPLIDWLKLLHEKKREGLCALLEQLIQKDEWYEQHCTVQQKTNCDLLMEKALRFERTQGSDLVSFIELIEEIQDEKSSESIPVSNEDDVVKVVTIHQSKGLQYPVVFYWSSSKLTFQEASDPCLADEELGIGCYTVKMPYRYRCGNLLRDAIAAKAEKEEIEENIRILYVALTRAQCAMICVDAYDESRDFRSLSMASVFERKGNTDLILSCRLDRSILAYRECFSLTNISVDPQLSKQLTRPLIRGSFDCKEPAVSVPSSLETRTIGDLYLSQSEKADQRGTQLHKVIEKCPLDNWTFELLQREFPTVKKEDIARLMKWYSHPFTQALLKKEKHHEMPFFVLKDGILTHGYMDFVAVDENCAVMVDFKSDRFCSRQQLLERYENQIRSYYESLKECFKEKRIETWIYSFELGEYIEVKSD